MKTSAIIVLLFCSAAAYGQVSPWRYVPQNPDSLTSLEWKKVLDSPYRELIWREIPAATVQRLSGINFIEGIERVIVSASGKAVLLVLSGTFDLARLREMAEADGGTVKPYRNAQLLLSSTPEEGGEEMALVSDKIILVGDRDSLMEAIDRSASGKGDARDAGYNLMIHSRRPAYGIEALDFALTINKGVQVHAKIQATSPELAERMAANGGLQQLTFVVREKNLETTSQFSREAFQRKMGQWRTSIEQLASVQVEAPAPVPVGPQKIRISGLDEGPREILLPPAKP